MAHYSYAWKLYFVCIFSIKLIFLFFFFSFPARIMLDSMRATQLSLFLGCIELFMGLMFLIPSLILCLQEQICAYIFHILMGKKDLLLYMAQLKNLYMGLSRMMSICKYLRMYTKKKFCEILWSL